MIIVPGNGSTALHDHDLHLRILPLFLSIRNKGILAGKIGLGLNFYIYYQTTTALHYTNSSITLDTLRKVNLI